jgi:hypothetical protein
MVKNPVIVFGAQARLVRASDSLTFTHDPGIRSLDSALTILFCLRLSNHHARMTAQPSMKSLKFPAI